MSVTQLLDHLQTLGITLTADVANLRVRGGGERMNPGLRAEIAMRKTEIFQKVAPPIFVDLETRSKCDIDLGGRRYAQHPTTELLSCVFWVDGRLIIWVPTGDPITASNAVAAVDLGEFGISFEDVHFFAGEAVPDLIVRVARTGRFFCAHSAHAFDRLVWEAKNLPHPGGWIDTLPLARLSGWPGALNKLAKLILGKQKDAAGSPLIDRLGKAFQHGEASPLTCGEITALIRYNVQDVMLLRDLYPFLSRDVESDVIEVDRIINARGIGFDVSLASALLELDREQRRRSTGGLADATNGFVTEGDLGRISFLRARLEDLGVRLPNLRRPTVEAALSQARDQQIQLPGAALAILEARMATSRNSSKKLTKAIELCDDDGRLRDQLIYHKGHTGRWAGRGVQLQNLPKPHKSLAYGCDLIHAVHDFDAFGRSLPPNVSVEDGISALIRPCLVPASGNVFCIADYAGIEARGVAWCAGEQVLLDRFHSGVDVYCELASRFFPSPVTREQGHERAIGKVAMLGCGYSMSASRFAEYARDNGVDLSAVGVTAEQIVEGYRNAYPAIAGFSECGGSGRWRAGGLWQDVEQAARNALSSQGCYTAGRCCFQYCGNALCVTLPSGRKMHYRNARLVQDPSGWGSTWKPKIVFDLPEHPNEESYGGKLVENIVQAICRDLLAAALVKCEHQGIPVVLHVHDEIVVETPESCSAESLETLLQIMSTPPIWANGFPVEVEGFRAGRYVKSPGVGATVVTYRGGIRSP